MVNHAETLKEDLRCLLTLEMTLRGVGILVAFFFPAGIQNIPCPPNFGHFARCSGGVLGRVAWRNVYGAT